MDETASGIAPTVPGSVGAGGGQHDTSNGFHQLTLEEEAKLVWDTQSLGETPEQAARRDTVVKLHRQGLTARAIAKHPDVDVCHKTVTKDLRARGLKPRRPGRPQVRTLTRAQQKRLAEERELRRQARRQREHDERRRRRHRVVELYGQGMSSLAIAAEPDVNVDHKTVLNDLAVMEVARRPSHRPAKYPPPAPRRCEQCSSIFTPDYPSLAVNGRGRFCSRECNSAAQARYPLVEERTCARRGCERRFRPHPSDVARGYGDHCSLSCQVRESWRRGKVSRTLSDAVIWSDAARRLWIDRWNGYQGAEHGAKGGQKKGQATALRTVDAAVRLVAENPSISRYRPLVEVLMLNLEGPETIFEHYGSVHKRKRRARDPVYRRARKRIERQLSRGFELRGYPPELALLMQR